MTASLNFIQEYASITSSTVSRVLSLWLPLIIFNTVHVNWMCLFHMPLYYISLMTQIYHWIM